MIAAAWGKIDLLELCLSLGAKLHATAPNGWTALEFAMKTNQTEVKIYLITYFNLFTKVTGCLCVGLFVCTEGSW